MNIQTPWVFFPSGIPTHHHHQSAAAAAAKASTNAAIAAAGLIPITCPPHGAQLLGHHHPSSTAAALSHHHHQAFAAGFNVAPGPHPQGPAAVHHSQLLLAAAAAAAYGQQCSHLLHQPQPPQQQIPNGYHHLKMHKVEDGGVGPGKRKTSGDESESVIAREIKKAKLETKALKAKRPGFTDERYNETSYYVENGLRKVYPYYFTFTTFTKGRWVGEKILDVFAREFRAHPVEEYERCIKSGTLTVNYTKVDTDYRLKHNDLLANIVHRHEVPVTSDPIEVIHMDEDLVVVNKPASIPVHPCGRYRHNTVVFILAKEHQLKNLRTIHRLDRLTSGLLLFGRSPKKAREMEQQIRNRLVQKQYVCRVEGIFPDEEIECIEAIEVVSYKIGVCKVSKDGKDCKTTFKKLSSNGKTSVVLAKPHTGRMHQIRVHLQYLGYPIVNDPLYNHPVFGPEKGKGGRIGKSDEQLIQDLISIHNAENWLGIEGEESGGGGVGDIFGISHSASPDNQTTTASPSSASGSFIGDCKRVASPSVNETLPDSKDTVIPVKDAGDSTVVELTLPQKTLTNEMSGEDKSIVSSTSVSIPEKVTVGTQTCNESEFEELPVQQAVKAKEQDTSTSTQAMTPSSSSPQTSDNNNTAVENPHYKKDLMTYDPHCYECKVRYRDPKPKDLIMYLHAIFYGGPEWQFQTKLPVWADENWTEPEDA